MKKYLIYILLLSSHTIWAQLNSYSFEDISTLKEQKPIVVFLHTNWCKYCKLMENTTLKNKKVINKLNKDFYFISFNGEKKDSIVFQNHTFKFKSTGKNTGIHELAEALGTYKSKVSFPTTIILNSNKEIIFQYPYALKTNEFLKVLNSVK